MNGNNFGDVIATITDKISEDFPEIREILAKAQRGELSEEQALGEMMIFTQNNPTIANKIAEIFMENAQDSTELEDEDEVFLMAKQGAKEVTDKKSVFDTVWEDRSDQGKRARFNPQYESYLAERLQFDKDIPELRTLPMDKDVMPAVDVIATSPNLAVVGDQLKRASVQVRAEQDTLEEEYTKQLSDKLEIGTEITKISTELDRSQVPQPKGYESGKLPVAREISEMGSDELICLSEDIRRENIWEVISTTQGRRSMSGVLAQIIKEKLGDHNIKVRIDPNGTGKVMSMAHWTMTIKGAKELQDNFSFVETCAYSLAYNLVTNMKKDYDPNIEYSLHITTINEYSIREIGWGARLMLETGK
jgi:hypothetical protein